MRLLLGLITLLFFIPYSSIHSQDLEITIDSDDTQQCEGVLLDTGGNGGSYGANENHSITWCAQNPETVLNLYWAIFSLVENSTITIYDGDSNDAPLIGIFSGTELQSENITSTNPTGCLTVEFVSVEGGGNFGALVSCGEPCEPPLAHAYWSNDNQLPYVDGYYRACLGDSLTLISDSSTSAGDNNPIVSWEWNMGDNVTYSGEPSITHVYDNPGLYTIDLIIEDSNDCQNQNTIDFRVLVSTDANPIITSDFPICVNDTAVIEGTISGVPYIAEPSNDFGDGLYIPDDQTQCFYSELTFTSFAPGSVIDDATVDIESFFVNMEHSYMGDLTIMLECPNGQSIYVHQQGGASTYLGEPIDDNTEEIPGIGYDYSWEPLSTNGTWADNAGFGGTLPAGSYASEQPFSNLDGCPLNGTWQIEVCDLFGIDNGFIFDWGIQFDPELYPEVVSFTPVFNLEDCDSTYWYTFDTPENIEYEYILEESQDDGDCSTVEINPDTTGIHTLIFHTINNFGCHYEDTLIVEVKGVDFNLRATPQQFCGQPLPIIATFNNFGVSLEDCDFEWSYTSSSGDVDIVPFANFPPSDTAAYLNEMEDPTTFTLEVSYNIPSSSETCINSDFIEIETCEITIPNVFTPNGDDHNDEWYVDGLGSFFGSEVYIYDRWGVEVHSYKIGSEGINPKWNGEIQNPVFKDVTVAEGVYYYVVKVYQSEGEELFVVDQDCPCQNGGFDIDCCQDNSMINQDEWTTYTGILTINR